MSAALGNFSKLHCARLHEIYVLFTCLLVYLVTKNFLYCDKFTQIMRKAHKSKAEKCAFTVSKCDFAVFFFDKNNQNRLSVWACGSPYPIKHQPKSLSTFVCCLIC